MSTKRPAVYRNLFFCLLQRGIKVPEEEPEIYFPPPAPRWCVKNHLSDPVFHFTQTSVTGPLPFLPKCPHPANSWPLLPGMGHLEERRYTQQSVKTTPELSNIVGIFRFLPIRPKIHLPKMIMNSKENLEENYTNFQINECVVPGLSRLFSRAHKKTFQSGTKTAGNLVTVLLFKLNVYKLPPFTGERVTNAPICSAELSSLVSSLFHHLTADSSLSPELTTSPGVIPTPPPPPALRPLLAVVLTAPPPEPERRCWSQATQLRRCSDESRAISLSLGVFYGPASFGCSLCFWHITYYFFFCPITLVHLQFQCCVWLTLVYFLSIFYKYWLHILSKENKL